MASTPPSAPRYVYDSAAPYDKSGIAYDGPAIGTGASSAGSAELFQRLRLPTIQKIFLMTITAGSWLRGGIVDSGTTYKFPRSLSIVDVQINSISLTLKTTIALVRSNPGSWISSGGWVYVNPPTGHTILTDTYLAIAKFFFSDRARILNDTYYEPRLKRTPILSLRIEPKFSGVGQIGGGQVSLINNDGYFDTLDDLQWDAGTATMLLAADLPVDPAAGAASIYSTIGTWRIDNTEKDNSDFILNLRERKTALELSIPFETYTLAAYPSLDVKDVGRVIPRAYGRLYGCKPQLLNAATKSFKLAGHAVRSIDEVRIKSGEAWIVSSFASRDLTNATFTLGSDFTGSESISVDFQGRTNPDGSLMENAADIVDDLLVYLGEFGRDSGTFNASRNALNIGLNKFGDNVCLTAPCLYIDSPTKAIDVIGQINDVVGSFLFVDLLGAWNYKVFLPFLGTLTDPSPSAVSKLQSFTGNDILDGTFRKFVDNQTIYAQVVASYAERREDKWKENLTATRLGSQFAHGAATANTLEKTLPLAKFTDAQYYAQRVLTTEGEPYTHYQFEVPWNSYFLLPGDRIHLTYTPRQVVDAILEVTDIQYDLVQGKARIVANNQRGWNDTFGFWLAGGGTFGNAAAISIPTGASSSDPSTAATPYPSSIIVSQTGTITNLTVGIIGFTHSSPWDCIFCLVTPTGKKIDLFCADELAAQSTPPIVNVNLVFDDAAAAPLVMNALIVSGTYQPSGYSTQIFPAMPPPAPARPFLTTLLSAVGDDPNGTWKLYIQDRVGFDAGGISGGWILNVATTSGVGGANWSAAWTSAQKQAARQNEGFWLGPDDMADSTDTGAFLPSRWW